MGTSVDETGSTHDRPSQGSRTPRTPKNSGALDGVKKWLGIGAAAVSLLSGVYGAVHYQAQKQQRAQRTAELLAAGEVQRKARDYPAAWASLQEASVELDREGLIVRALGGVSAQQARVRTAQEDLAMQWLREGGSQAQPGHGAEIPDAVLPVLLSGESEAQGARKADLLAHIGWAYWLKALAGAQGVRQLQFYREAIALDPHNPYANTYWAIPVLEGTSASAAGVAQARQLFGAALSSARARGELRVWIRTEELGAVRSWARQYGPAATFFWQIVSEMSRAGEPLDADTLDDLGRLYVGNTISVAAVTGNLDRALAAVPDPALHAALLEQVVPTLQGELQGLGQAALALALEKAGRPQEALAAWRAAHTGPAGADLGKDVEAAIACLEPAAAASPARPAAASGGHR